jgi:hypothetical protein
LSFLRAPFGGDDDPAQDATDFVRFLDETANILFSENPGRFEQSQPVVRFSGLLERYAVLVDEVGAALTRLGLFDIRSHGSARANYLREQVRAGRRTPGYSISQPNNLNRKLKRPRHNVTFFHHVSSPFLPFAFSLVTFIVALFVDFAPIFSSESGHNSGNAERLCET